MLILKEMPVKETAVKNQKEVEFMPKELADKDLPINVSKELEGIIQLAHCILKSYNLLTSK